LGALPDYFASLELFVVRVCAWIRCSHLCLFTFQQYCSGRGTCQSGNKTKCDCWDPARWSGDRCDVSVCGPHGILISGDFTVGECIGGRGHYMGWEHRWGHSVRSDGSPVTVTIAPTAFSTPLRALLSGPCFDSLVFACLRRPNRAHYMWVRSRLEWTHVQHPAVLCVGQLHQLHPSQVRVQPGLQRPQLRRAHPRGGAGVCSRLGCL
jgi:hypothetical protein